LQDNVFNRCRTAIKWYEASVLKQPSATLAQETGPYQDEIQDGKTGLLFKTPEEFEHKLSMLIEDAGLRHTLAAGAKDWVSENRDAMKHVPAYIAYLQELRAAAPKEQPHMPDAAFDKMVADIEAAEKARQEQEKGATDGVLSTSPLRRQQRRSLRSPTAPGRRRQRDDCPGGQVAGRCLPPLQQLRQLGLLHGRGPDGAGDGAVCGHGNQCYGRAASR